MRGSVHRPSEPSGGSARRIEDKVENTYITISPKILLQLFLKYAYTRHFDSSVWKYIIFWQHFANFPKRLKNNFVNELDSNLLQSNCFLKVSKNLKSINRKFYGDKLMNQNV